MSSLFVSYLNRYITISPEHEAAFDEFIMQAAPLSGLVVLRLETKTGQFVRACFRRKRPPSIILTGNAAMGESAHFSLTPLREKRAWQHNRSN